MEGGGNFLIVMVEKFVVFFVCVSVHVCFIPSILSNNQKVTEPVYWASPDGTSVCVQVNSSKKSKAVKVFLQFFLISLLDE
jgi:hypothetical protein